MFLSKDYLHPDDHDKPITDTPGFKPFTKFFKMSQIRTEQIVRAKASFLKQIA